MKATEDKLLSTMPDKERRKYLALKSTASAEEVASASEDIRQWQASSMSIDAQLKTGQMQNLGHHNSGGISTNEVFSQISRVQREKIEEAGRKLKVAELTEFQKERRAGNLLVCKFCLLHLTRSCVKNWNEERVTSRSRHRNMRRRFAFTRSVSRFIL